MIATPRVLMVEDDPDALCGYLEFLAASGFETTGVPNGAAALLVARDYPPDIVVTDITLPDMNGFELATLLRGDARTRHVPIIGLTAHWNADVHARARDAAMQVVLAKPCLPAHLLGEIQRLLKRANALDNVSPARPRRMTLPALDPKGAWRHLPRGSRHFGQHRN